MKSKKRTRAVANKADWQEKWIDVLALRDITRKTDPSGDSFGKTVIAHLRKAYGVEYNLSQVARKLDHIWDSHGRYGVPKRPNLIYREGSACLANLAPEMHEKIEKRRNAIAHEQLIDSLSQRATRSASECGSKTLLPFDIEASRSPRKKTRPTRVQQSPCRNDTKADQEYLQVTLNYSRVAYKHADM